MFQSPEVIRASELGNGRRQPRYVSLTEKGEKISVFDIDLFCDCIKIRELGGECRIIEVMDYKEVFVWEWQ